MSSIMVVVEAFNGGFKKSSLEAISYGKVVADKLGSTNLVLVLGESDSANQLGQNGADKILHINQAVQVADNQSLAKFISEIAINNGADLIVMVNNSTARGLVGRLAIRLKSGCATGVSSLPQKEGNQWTVERSVYAGKAKARLELSGACAVISIGSGVVPVKSDGTEVPAEIIEYSTTSNIKLLETKRVAGKTPLPEAEIVVSAGRGLKDPSNWGIVEDLAESLGATTACSRPVADSGWRPHHEHVGQTGIAIKPKLYIALGISGAIQHLAGVNNSKVIVVVNKDPEAPFFKAADYGIIGDLFEVVPKLTAAINKLKSQN